MVPRFVEWGLAVAIALTLCVLGWSFLTPGPSATGDAATPVAQEPGATSASQWGPGSPDEILEPGSEHPEDATRPPSEEAQDTKRNRKDATRKQPRGPDSGPVDLRDAAEAAAAQAHGPVTFRIATFNVLGSHHTKRGAKRSRVYPPASVRTAGAAALITQHGVDVIGLQELNNDQHDDLLKRLGWQSWPGHTLDVRSETSIMWNPAVFELVSGHRYWIVYRGGGQRPQTVVRLKHRTTAREIYVLNTHVVTRDMPVRQRMGHDAVISNVNRLRAEGLPVFVTGDMNNREAFFCHVAPRAELTAAIGGTTTEGCRPAARLTVDWLLATREAQWTGYWEDRSPLRRISDHHFISATATLGAGN